MATQAANLPLEAAKIITFIDSPRDIILNIQGDTDPARFKAKLFQNKKELPSDLLPSSSVTGQQIVYSFSADKIKALNSYFTMYIYLDDDSKFGFPFEVRSGFGESNDQAFDVTVNEGGNVEFDVSITDQQMFTDGLEELRETREFVDSVAGKIVAVAAEDLMGATLIFGASVEVEEADNVLEGVTIIFP